MEQAFLVVNPPPLCHLILDDVNESRSADSATITCHSFVGHWALPTSYLLPSVISLNCPLRTYSSFPDGTPVKICLCWMDSFLSILDSCCRVTIKTSVYLGLSEFI